MWQDRQTYRIEGHFDIMTTYALQAAAVKMMKKCRKAECAAKCVQVVGSFFFGNYFSSCSFFLSLVVFLL